MSSLIILIPPFLMGMAVDEFIATNNLIKIGLICLELIGISIIGALVSYFLKYKTGFVGRYVVKDIRLDLFSHVNKFSFAYFDETSTGDIISRIMSDSQEVIQFLTNSLIDLLINIVVLFGILYIMSIWNIYFFFIVLLLFPLIFFSQYIYVEKVTPAKKRIMVANSTLTSATHNIVGGLQEVKLYAREEYMGGIFNKWNKEYYDAVVESIKYNALWGPFIPFIVSLSISNSCFAENLAALIIRSLSSPNRFLGSPTVRRTLFFISFFPSK